jgi:GTP-binding protein
LKMDRLNNVKYFKTAVAYNDLGDCVAEVAFIGRSNVGKSSVINAVADHKQLARTSQTPGKTRTINIYTVEHFRWLVDLPGYGYAVGPASERSNWAGMIEGYLKSRHNLNMVFMIIDAKVGPTKYDLQMAEWLNSENIPFTIVANKIDKIACNALEAQKSALANEMALKVRDIYWVSALRKAGIRELIGCVAEHLELARK